MGGDIFTADHLVLFIAFFIPGFIASQIYGQFIGVDHADFSKRLPIVIGYSAIHYAITGWMILIAPPGLIQDITAYVVVFFLPIFWTPAILLLRDPKKWSTVFFRWGKSSLTKLREQLLSPEPTPWDRIQISPKYVRIRLKSGRYVGGFFGQGSALSSFPFERQILVSNAYHFDKDGTFMSEIPDTWAFVQGDDIELLELIELPKGEK